MSLKTIIEKVKAWKEIIVLVVCIVGWIVTVSVAGGMAHNENDHQVKRVDAVEQKVTALTAERDRLVRIETLLETVDARLKLLERVLVPPSMRPQP